MQNNKHNTHFKFSADFDFEHTRGENTRIEDAHLSLSGVFLNYLFIIDLGKFSLNILPWGQHFTHFTHFADCSGLFVSLGRRHTLLVARFSCVCEVVKFTSGESVTDLLEFLSLSQVALCDTGEIFVRMRRKSTTSKHQMISHFT